MKRILFIGSGNDALELVYLLSTVRNMKIAVIIDFREETSMCTLARELSIPMDRDWRNWINQDIDIIIETTGSEQTLKELCHAKENKTIIVPPLIVDTMTELVRKKELSLNEVKEQQYQKLILSHMDDGLIVINTDEIVDFVNRRAEEIIGIPQRALLQKTIREVIEKTRLPEVLHTRRKEVNQELILENGRKVITTRVPIIDSKGRLQGAFAVFKDITDVVEMTERVMGLKEVEKIIETIVYSSDEAISLVDEDGIGLMINSAYSKLTGLSEQQIIGRPAYSVIPAEENMHMKVLETRRPIKGVRTKVGPSKREVIINAAPIITDGKLKGSISVLHDVSQAEVLAGELQRARQIIRSIETKYTFDDIIGSSGEMALTIEQAKAGARTQAAVLLRGESGTGKKQFAQAIHNQSDRKNNKYIRVNCAGLKECSLEKELFGSEQKINMIFNSNSTAGCFERANHGTVFLDEIGELSLSLQKKLLRVLQSNKLMRMDGSGPVAIDIRIIAASTKNIEQAVTNGEFLEDLYYHLNRFPIFVPPLRQRLDDLEELTCFLIKQVNSEHGRNVKYIEGKALDYLKQYQWPGNIRELKSVIDRAMIVMDMNETVICLEHLPELVTSRSSTRQSESLTFKGQSLQTMMDSYEKEIIQSAYQSCGFNKTKTAELLSISLRNLYYKMDKYSINKNTVQDLS